MEPVWKFIDETIIKILQQKNGWESSLFYMLLEEDVNPEGGVEISNDIQ